MYLYTGTSYVPPSLVLLYGRVERVPAPRWYPRSQQGSTPTTTAGLGHRPSFRIHSQHLPEGAAPPQGGRHTSPAMDRCAKGE